MKGKRNNVKHGKAGGREKQSAADLVRFFDRPACRDPACPGGVLKVDQHHVVYQQEVRRRKGDLWDPANALALCASCHARHHHQLTPLRLTALRDENIAFAFKLMGGAAYDYLQRRYDGEDPRLELALQSSDALESASPPGGGPLPRPEKERKCP